MNKTIQEKRIIQNNKIAYGNTAYNRNNVVRKRELDLSIAEPRKRNLVEVPSAPHAPGKSHFKMSLGYLMFLVCALVMVGYVLFGYIKLQAEITSHVEAISTLESKLNDLTIVNEEEYTRLMSSIDLEEINLVARQELGMVNATSTQIIEVSRQTDDYVTQTQAIPSE